MRKRKWTKDGLEVKLDFAPDAQSQAVAEKWDAGHLRGLSIGFLPRPGEVDFAIEDHDDIEYGLFVVTVGVSDLLELSAVAVPRDGDALKASLATGGIDVAAERGRLMAQREPDYSGIKDVLENAFR